MSDRGISLVELLVAASITLLVVAALVSIVPPARDSIRRAQLRSDIDSGIRAVLQQIAFDVRQAGNDAAVGPPARRLAQGLARVVATRDLDARAPLSSGSAVTVRYIPYLAAQGALAEPMLAGETVARLDTSTRCATGPPACGFRAGQTAALQDADLHVVTISSVASGVVQLSTPVPAAVQAGATLAELVSVTYGTRSSSDGSRRLVRVSTGGAEQPMLDHVADFAVTLAAHEAHAATGLSITLRVEAALPEFRGPAGYLFLRGGTARSARRWVPDAGYRIAIAMRPPPLTP